MPSVILQPVLMDDNELEQFLPYVEHCEVSHEMKMQILRNLCKVPQCFIDEAWGNWPTQQAARNKPDRNSN